MNARLNSLLSSVLLLVASSIAVSAVHREFFPRSAVAPPVGGVDYVATWRKAAETGYRIGSPVAPVTIVEVVDLECPACSRYQAVLRKVMMDHPDSVALLLVQYPLPQHRFALPAARAAECAQVSGHFEQWVSAVFAHQDSLGLESWGTIALAAGIADTGAISRCALDSRPVPHLQAGMAFIESLHLRSTPTILINGWRYPLPPTAEEINLAIPALLRGLKPPDLIPSGG